MTINVNSTNVNLVYVDDTRMKLVNVDGTEVYRADNGEVTMVYTGSQNGTFDPGAEDVNRHFVVVGTRFSGGGLPLPTTPTINGTSMTLITSGTSDFNDDGGIAGIYTIKIPTGTGTFTLAQSGTTFTTVAVYRVTGIEAMTTSTALFFETNPLPISGNKTSSANGCFFGANVSNFLTPAYPTPNILALRYDGGNQGRIAATNATTGPTQSVLLNASQINCCAIFAYDYY
jgi:hypothetical protein